ncbi:hypothetical protein HC251_17540 [Iamia sp. SCSIO 61187]|uniref:DUF421 domain-containing protein n=1 Tax=Iamia sp. SCSIO 61187 TaxID=2722752 RepID=UPI001C62BBD3|nr:hypothetical protein [Iamia sp. SCSIO 61187]QYG94064.1 hypothetical protein HC251_17540 [Iamia sp. SCSIO 61187]
MSTWFGSTWGTVGFIVLSTTATYASAVACVRLAGRRTVAQMSAFDAVITIALGSIVATTAVSATTSYVEGMTALVTLLVLQVVLAWARRRWPALHHAVEAGAEVVADRGRISLPRGLTTSQMSGEELRARLRQSGHAAPPPAGIVLLEADGKVSVLADEAEAAAVRDLLGRG